MNRFRTAAVAVAGVLVALAFAAPAGAAVKVGVVDIVEVMNSYDRVKDASADLQIEQANLREASQPRIKKVEELRLQRDGFNKGTEEYQRLDQQALEAEMELRTWLAVEQAKLERRHTETLLDMYNEIRKVVAAQAAKSGLDIVFTKAFLNPPQIDLDRAQGLEDLKQRIVGQRLMYPTGVVEITQDVLKQLNTEYRAAKGAEPQG